MTGKQDFKGVYMQRQRFGNVNRDNKIFRGTARKTKRINAVQMVNRGGIRL